MSLTTSLEESSSGSSNPVPNLQWHATAPRRVVAFGEPGSADVWPAWVKHLSRRKRPRSLARLLDTRRSPLQWATPDPVSAETPDPAEWLERLARIADGRRFPAEGLPEQLSAWLAELTVTPLEPLTALECLAVCHALPRLSRHVPAAFWWELLGFLITLAGETEEPDATNPSLLRQLIGGELALTLAYTFPEFVACRELAASASRAMSAVIDESLDGEGHPRAAQLDRLLPLLASWTRSQTMGRVLHHAPWTEAAGGQVDRACLHVVRLARRDGSLAFTTASTGKKHNLELITRAVDVLGDRKARRAVANVFGDESSRRATKKLPLPGMHSDWSELGVLWTRWSSAAPRLSVAYDNRRLRIELDSGRELLLAGDATPEIHFDGQRLELASDWKSVSSEIDEDVDYLELEATFSGGVRIERQMTLVRKDRLLFIGDAVFATQAGALSYRSPLPLVESITWQPADETREGVLTGRKHRATIVPLALSEWRSDPRGGELRGADGSLELHQSAQGRALYAPLVIDLDPSRRKKPLTWRTLSVAEDRVNVARDVAVGYRLQIGKEQWITYRSLTGDGYARSLLGHHLVSEFLLARFDGEGEVESLIEIEN